MDNFFNLKGNINHSVCRWCYDGLSLDVLCTEANKLGIKSIDLIGPDDFEILHKHKLDCGMVYGLPDAYGIEKCFNQIANHDDLFEIYRDLIPIVSDAGFKNIICFSGNRDGISDEKGLENCEIGLKRIMPLAEKHNVNIYYNNAVKDKILEYCYNNCVESWITRKEGPKLWIIIRFDGKHGRSLWAMCQLEDMLQSPFSL